MKSRQSESSRTLSNRGLKLIGSGCPLCGQTRGRQLWSFSPPDRPGVFYLEQCPACGNAFLNPRPAQEELDRFFSARGLYLKTTDPEGRSRSLLKERNRRRSEYMGYVRRIRNTIRPGPVLDLGCGLGLFLELLGPGFDRLGLDLNPEAVEYIRKNLDFPVLESDVGQARFAPESFNMISLMQTLDHLDQPGVLLENVRAWLKPGGLLFLSALINLNSFCARVFREGFRLLHPFHLVYFTPAGLRRLLTGLKFKIIRLEYPYLKTPYATVADPLNLIKKIGLKLLAHRSGQLGTAISSPPFFGNIMNVYAIRAG